jgi:competence protein ComFB
LHLRNYMEIAVDHIMPNLLRAFPDICVCDQCQLDIKAIALNHLKPHYTVTDEGETWTKIDEMRIQFEADIMKALIDAISLVTKSPRHGKEKDVKQVF